MQFPGSSNYGPKSMKRDEIDDKIRRVVRTAIVQLNLPLLK